jgi:hypothetical protein
MDPWFPVCNSPAASQLGFYGNWIAGVEEFRGTLSSVLRQSLLRPGDVFLPLNEIAREIGINESDALNLSIYSGLRESTRDGDLSVFRNGRVSRVLPRKIRFSGDGTCRPPPAHGHKCQTSFRFELAAFVTIQKSMRQR